MKRASSHIQALKTSLFLYLLGDHRKDLGAGSLDWALQWSYDPHLALTPQKQLLTIYQLLDGYDD